MSFEDDTKLTAFYFNVYNTFFNCGVFKRVLSIYPIQP